MKRTVIFCLILLSISCSQNTSQKIESAPQPVVEISATPNDAVEQNPAPAYIEVKTGNPLIYPPNDSGENDKDEEPFFKELIKEEAKKFGISDLENLSISKDDLEIRVWQIAGLFMREYKNMGIKESLFILKRTKGNWSAKVFRNTVNLKSKVEKRIRKKLDSPKSGFDNVWQNLLDDELLTFPDSISREALPVPDGEICIIESKVDGIYKTYAYSGNGEIREIRHTAKILNIIAEEFDLEDFRATEQYEQ